MFVVLYLSVIIVIDYFDFKKLKFVMFEVLLNVFFVNSIMIFVVINIIFRILLNQKKKGNFLNLENGRWMGYRV